MHSRLQKRENSAIYADTYHIMICIQFKSHSTVICTKRNTHTLHTYFKVRFTCYQSKNKKNSAKYSEIMAWI